MSNFRPRYLQKRALLTETLPAEVPIVFSNSALFGGTLPLNVRPDTSSALNNFRSTKASHTIPLTFTIKKGRASIRTLSIIHPHMQIELATFIDNFAETLLAYCGKSVFSIRKPVSIVSPFSDEVMQKGPTPKDGIPHDLLLDGAPDYSSVTSFFRYDSYNLLGKFIDSAEFVDLEESFSRLRILDVSKCFYNLYTHSLTWAVKGKPYAKSNKTSYSFESEFDRLMQKSNYSETNGIVVGPELSRVFSEVIFQEIDKRILDRLVDYVPGHDYHIRRYIDDFYVFGKTEEQIDLIQGVVAQVLEEFKLYLNPAKGQDFTRPFVTPLTLAKSQLADVIESILPRLRRAVDQTDFNELGRIASAVRRRVRRVREVVSGNDVGVHNVSGWLLATIRREVGAILELYKGVEAQNVREAIVQILVSTFKVAFYVCSVDLRVRTTFSLTYLLLLVRRAFSGDDSEEAEWLQNYLFEQHIELLGNFWRELKKGGLGCASSVELANLLCGGAFLYGERFARHGTTNQILGWMGSQEISYFSYISQKYVMLKSSSRFAADLQRLNERAVNFFGIDRELLALDTERFLMLSDYLSAPDISPNIRLAKYHEIFGGSLSLDGFAELARLVGFVDWEGLSLEHVLERQHLRPTYAHM